MLRFPEFLDEWHMKVFRSGCPVIYITLYFTYTCTHFSAVWCVVVQNVLSEDIQFSFIVLKCAPCILCKTVIQFDQHILACLFLLGVGVNM